MVESVVRWVGILVALGCAVLAGFAVPGKTTGSPLLAAIAGGVAVALLIGIARLLPAPKRIPNLLASGALVFFTFACSAILAPVFASSRTVKERSVCFNNMRKLCMASQLYLADWDDRFPISTKWSTSLDQYESAIGDLRCPLAAAPHSYAMNSGLSAKTIDGYYGSITALFFDADAWETNASGGREWVSRRHRGGAFVGCADGTVKFVGFERLAEMRWAP